MQGEPLFTEDSWFPTTLIRSHLRPLLSMKGAEGRNAEGLNNHFPPYVQRSKGRGRRRAEFQREAKRKHRTAPRDLENASLAPRFLVFGPHPPLASFQTPSGFFFKTIVRGFLLLLTRTEWKSKNHFHSKLIHSPIALRVSMAFPLFGVNFPSSKQAVELNYEIHKICQINIHHRFNCLFKITPGYLQIFLDRL